MPIEAAIEHADQQQRERPVGVRLRQARHEQNLSEKEVADRLHITMHYIKALETDRYEKLPGAVFTRGYIKSYAELLRLDPAELVANYDAYRAEIKEARDANDRLEVHHRQDKNRPFVVASLVLFVGGFIGLWLVSSVGGDSGNQAANSAVQASEDNTAGASTIEADTQSAPTAATLRPAVVSSSRTIPEAPLGSAQNASAGTAANTVPEAVSDSPESTADGNQVTASSQDEVVSSDPVVIADNAGPAAEKLSTSASGQLIEVRNNGSDVLRIRFSGESWVEVNDGTEQRVYQDLLAAGDVLEITGNGPFDILLGDAPLTQLEFNGDEVDVSDDIRIDNSARLTVGL